MNVQLLRNPGGGVGGDLQLTSDQDSQLSILQVGGVEDSQLTFGGACEL